MVGGSLLVSLVWWQRISGVIVCLFHVTLYILYSVCYIYFLLLVAVVLDSL